MIRDITQRLRETAHSARENVPKWFVVLSLCLMLLMPTTAVVQSQSAPNTDETIYRDGGTNEVYYAGPDTGPVPLGFNATAIGREAVDVDGDGLLEMPYQSTDGYIWWRELGGNDHINTSVQFSTEDAIMGGVSDIDGDGAYETSFLDGSVITYVDTSGNTDPVLTATQNHFMGSIDDYDQDGQDELFSFGSGSDMSVVEADGSVTDIAGSVPGRTPGYIVDWNSDGSIEFVYSRDDASSTIRAVDPSGTVVITTGHGDVSDPGGIGEPGDFDGDGSIEVPIVNSSGNAMDYLQSDGTYTTNPNADPGLDGGIGPTRDWSSYFGDITPSVKGTVTDTSGQAIENATVEATQSGTVVATAQTGPNGDYVLQTDNGTFTVTASAEGYFSDSANVTVSGSDVTQNFELLELSEALAIDTKNYLKHGQTAPYTVTFSSDGGQTRDDVTGTATVTSGDVDVITINTVNQEIEATENTSVANRTYVQANYTVDNQTYVTRQNVTVANSTVENLAILPPMWRVNATFSSSTIQAILVAIFAGIFGARVSTSFGGLALMQLMMVAGWFTGYATIGVTMISLFTALFIGLNMAANIDYMVGR